jgi:Zn-dependent membrane protease YugP
MVEAPLALLKLRVVLMDVPQRVLACSASCCLGLIIWAHRHHRASSHISGGQAAAAILASHLTDMKVYRVEGWLVDCYYPKKNAILPSASNFEGTTVGAISIAAHEVGHALQARRWYAPYWLSWLLAKPAEIALAVCFWL